MTPNEASGATWLIAESTGVDARAYIRRFMRNVLAIIRGQECPRHTIFADRSPAVARA